MLPAVQSAAWTGAEAPLKIHRILFKQVKPTLLLVLAFCWYLTRFQIIPEEKALLATFGQEFAQYMARVGRWF